MNLYFIIFIHPLSYLIDTPTIHRNMHPNPEIIRGNEFLATQRKTIPTMEGYSRQRCMNEAFAIASRKKKENK